MLINNYVKSGILAAFYFEAATGKPRLPAHGVLRHRLVFPETPAAAAKLGFQLDVFEVREAGEMAGAIAAAKARDGEALDIFSDAIFAFPPNRVPDLAAQAGLPSIS